MYIVHTASSSGHVSLSAFLSQSSILSSLMHVVHLVTACPWERGKEANFEMQRKEERKEVGKVGRKGESLLSLLVASCY